MKISRQRAARTLFSVSAAALMMLPEGCQTVAFRSRCPALASYSKEFQANAAKELPKAGKHVQELVTDYGQFRDACRAIENPDAKT
jgi:hypothetical protein